MAQGKAGPVATQTSANDAAPKDAARAVCLERIDAMLRSSASLTFASVSTVDGRSFAHRAVVDGITGPRIAALTSSLLALSESLATEGQFGKCDYSLTSADGGSIVLVRIPASKPIFALSVGVDNTDNVGTALHYSLSLARELAEALG